MPCSGTVVQVGYSPKVDSQRNGDVDYGGGVVRGRDDGMVLQPPALLVTSATHEVRARPIHEAGFSTGCLVMEEEEGEC